MDFGKAFSFMFEDPRWKEKLGIGTLVALAGFLFSSFLIGLVPLAMVVGYSLVTLRNVMDRHEHPMPEWQDWGGFFVKGLKLAVATFVWVLPSLIIAIPVVIGGTLMENQGSTSSAATGFGGLLIACGSCLLLLWGLFVALITPAIYIRLAATDRLSSAFQIGKLWQLTRENLGNVIISLLLIIVASLIAAMVGMAGLLLLVCGVLVTLPAAMLWQYLVQAHLFGQIGRDTVTPLE